MSIYRFLEAAYISDRYYIVGATASTADVGGTLPPGWAPTGNVDPLDYAAIVDFFGTGPQFPEIVRQQWSDFPIQFPGIYWEGQGLKFRSPTAEALVNENAFCTGAILLGARANVEGSSPFNDVFQKGVLSFWMNYDASVSSSGDSVKIFQGELPGTTFSVGSGLNCMVNKPAGLPPTLLTACVTMVADPLQMTFNLQDQLSGLPLVTVAVPYVQPDQAGGGTQAWANIGSLPQLFVPPNSTFNGRLFDSSGGTIKGFWAAPCSNAKFTECTTNPARIEDILGSPVFRISDAGHLPPIDQFNQFFTYIVNPDFSGTTYPPASLPGTVYQVFNSGERGGTPSGNKWHHYIFSWDTSQIVTDNTGAQCIRVQCAIDRGGGQWSPGGIFDTNASAPGTQPFLNQLQYFANTGSLAVSTSDQWVITAPVDAPAAFAYPYFGVANTFFDLTVPANLNKFISSDLGAKNLGGSSGISVPGLAGIWFHCGDANTITGSGGPTFLWNRCSNPPVLWTLAGNMYSFAGPPIASI